MQDILKKYKQHKLLWNIGIIVTSLIMAIWINFFVIDSTSIGQNLKTSVLNANNNVNLADIYLEKQDNTIKLKTSKDINNVKRLSFNVSYNPETLTIEKINPLNKKNAQILNISNDPWINSITIIYNNIINLKKSETIILLKTKKLKDQIENINIFDANFDDNKSQTSLLTTSWISF